MIYAYAFLATFWAFAATMHLIDAAAEIERLEARKAAQTDPKSLKESENRAEKRG